VRHIQQPGRDQKRRLQAGVRVSETFRTESAEHRHLAGTGGEASKPRMHLSLQNCMEYMSIMAVLVNCALIGLSGQVHRMFPDMTATQTILLIVALEHIMLVIRFIITCAIPDIPAWLATEMAKIEWARREASRLGNTSTPSPEELSSKLIGR
jgi:hypothetical protein